MIRAFAIIAATALTNPASAQQPPRGYVAATIYGQVPGASRTMRLYILKRYCGLKIPALTQDLQPASAGAICDH